MSNIKNEKLKTYVEEMEKAMPKQQEQEAPKATKKEPEPVHYDAFTMGIISKDGRYHIVRVPFNTVTMQSGTATIEHSEGSRYEICERFKIIAANEMEVL